ASPFQVFIGGVLAQRQPNTISGCRADQWRAAHLHGFDRARRVAERFQPRLLEAMRQHRLVDDADALAIAFQPNGARLFAVDFHGASDSEVCKDAPPRSARWLSIMKKSTT